MALRCWLLLALTGCAGHLDTVRPVAPDGVPEATTAWPAFVTPEDRELLAASEREIETSRKGELLLTVLDARGLPAKDVTVTWRQITHDFQFGVSGMFAPAVWGDLVRAGINHGTVAVDWAGTEPDPDSWTLEAVEASHGLGILPGLGVDMRASAALWMTPDRTPDHVRKLNRRALLSAVDRHVRGLVSRLRGKVVLWDALREPNPEWANAVGQDPDALVLLAQTAALAVRTVDSVTPIGVSLANPLGEGQALAPMALVKRLLDAKVDLDVVGLEYYYNGYRRHPPKEASGVPTTEARRGLTEIAASLDDFARFGRTLHVSGVSVPSVPAPHDPALAGYWGRRWSEELQAVYLRAFYTVAFGHPAVKAVVWRDALDSGAFVEHGGLFRKPGSAKPAFWALEDLIGKWTTRGEQATQEDGLIRFRGFGGRYVLDVANAVTGEHELRTVRVREGELDSAIIDLPDAWLPPSPSPSQQ